MRTRLATARPHLLAGGLYLALALLLVAPVLCAPRTLALGHPGNDVGDDADAARSAGG